MNETTAAKLNRHPLQLIQLGTWKKLRDPHSVEEHLRRGQSNQWSTSHNSGERKSYGASLRHVRDAVHNLHARVSETG